MKKTTTWRNSSTGKVTMKSTQHTFMEITYYDGALDEEGRLATATELGLAVVEPDQSVAWVWVARTLRATDWAVTQGE